MQKGVIPLELFRLLGTIAIKNKDANDALKETSDHGEKAEKKLSTSFLKIGKSALKIGTFAAGAAVAVGGAMASIADSTREYRNEMGKLEAAYKTAGHSAEVAKKTHTALYAVLGDTGQAVEAANHLAKLVDNEQDLATWTDICTGVYATFGASLPIEGLTEAANETAKTGQLTGSLADALNWAGIAEDDFQASLDACNTEQERQALITETLNGLYAEAANNYKEVNKDVLAANEAQAKLEEGLAAVGAICEPVITKLKYFAGTVLLKVVDSIKKVIAAATPMIEKFQRIIEVVGNAIAKIKEFFAVEGSGANITVNTETKTPNGKTVNVQKHAAGGILTKPTIFGYTPSTGTYHLGGEAGTEAVAPIDVLQGYVKTAVADGMKTSGSDRATKLLEQMVELLQISATNNTRIEINGREFGRMVKEYA